MEEIGPILDETEGFLRGTWKAGGWDESGPDRISPRSCLQTSSAPPRKRLSSAIPVGGSLSSSITH